MNDSSDNHFRAKLLDTKLTRKSWLINKREGRQIAKIEKWLIDSNPSSDNQESGTAKGHLVLFHGPKGSGKTRAASLLGKHSDQDVYQVDLSLVVSKFIGETEKNLNRLFDTATRNNWILLFDEADALFGKRSKVRDAHDKYANQEVSYFLQRLERHDGLVILSTEKLDEESVDLFETTVEFKRPNLLERKMHCLRNFWKR